MIKFKMPAGGHLGKLQTAISQRRIIRFTVCMYTQIILCRRSLIYNDGDSKLISSARSKWQPTVYRERTKSRA